MIKTITTASVTALVGAVLFAAPTNAASGHFGAIAYSPDDNKFGWVNHVASKNDAIDGAIAQCETKGGTSCDWAAWNQDGCMAVLVDSDGNWAGGAGSTPKQAVKDAQKLAEKNGYTINSQTPLAAICTSDTGPDAG